jgi:hypothetical protein
MHWREVLNKDQTSLNQSTELRLREIEVKTCPMIVFWWLDDFDRLFVVMQVPIVNNAGNGRIRKQRFLD